MALPSEISNHGIALDHPMRLCYILPKHRTKKEEGIRMIWDREQYISHSLFQDTGREMFCELFGPLHALEKEWRNAGASESEINMTAFDWDYVPVQYLKATTGVLSGIEPKILEDTPELTIARDALGRTTKLIKKSATVPLPLNFPLNEEEDWKRIRPWYEFREKRIDREFLKSQKTARDHGELTVLSVPGAFDELRELMGEEMLCISCYESPELLLDILQVFTETVCKVIERVSEIVPIDVLFVHEDMAGNTGPLFGPVQIRQFFRPYYTQIWEAAKSKGTRLFSLDSDGDISPILDDLLNFGINCIHPCQPVGGMDIVKLREKYGKRVCLKGGIDKYALLRGPQAIDQELKSRMNPLLFGGGTIFALDHRIPNGVTIENYRYYVTRGREILGLPPVSETGWRRMAF